MVICIEIICLNKLFVYQDLVMNEEKIFVKYMLDKGFIFRV